MQQIHGNKSLPMTNCNRLLRTCGILAGWPAFKCTACTAPSAVQAVQVSTHCAASFSSLQNSIESHVVRIEAQFKFFQNKNAQVLSIRADCLLSITMINLVRNSNAFSSFGRRSRCFTSQFRLVRELGCSIAGQ